MNLGKHKELNMKRRIDFYFSAGDPGDAALYGHRGRDSAVPVELVLLLFGLCQITFWQALGPWVLCRIVWPSAALGWR
jgi:hypothetical protein